MPYIFTLLFLASLILLVIGLISPAKALFWYKGKRERKQAFLIYLLCSLFTLAGIGVTAPEVNAIVNAETTSEKDSTKDKPSGTNALLSQASEPIDYSKFSYQLPESNYSFSIEISNIETKVKKDAFVHQNDQYSQKEKVDGYILKVKYKMTNPYDKVIMAPVPSYYYIGTLDKSFFSASTTFHRECQCQIDNSTDLTDAKGKRIYLLSDGRCGYGDPCVKFEPKETKEFIITFTDPVYKDAKRLIFSGFYRRGQSPNSTRRRDIVLLLDTEQKKVITEIQL